jgi:hypothetical protein
MNILSVIVYGRGGEARSVDFQPGRLNVLTGNSKTGKTALLDIVDFCLGRDTVTLPAGLISRSTSWYGLLVEIDKARVFIGRPNPDTATTNQAMVVLGGGDLQPPSASDLTVNADTSVVRETLSQLLGIEPFEVEPELGRLRAPFTVSVAHAVLMCLQKQNEIAGQQFLFHRQADRQLADSLRQSLPYFLGVDTPERAALRQELLQARRQVRRLQADLDAFEANREQEDARLLGLLRECEQVGLIAGGVFSGVSVVERLRSVAEAGELSPVDEIVPDYQTRQQQALAERRRLRRQAESIESDLAALRSLNEERVELSAEVAAQHGRLRVLDLLPNRFREEEVDHQRCPLCSQELPEPDPTISQLQNLLEDLSTSLASVSGPSPRRRSVELQLEAERQRLADALRANSALLNGLSETDRALQADQELSTYRSFVRGKVTQELSRLTAEEDDATLRNSLVWARDRVAALEETLADEDSERLLSEALADVSEDLTLFARALELENSEHHVRFDASRLTVVADTPGGRIPLMRMGSAENWVGYHLAAHLALHRFFVVNDRPVPRFLMFDQPTQAFFPEETSDATDIQDADWGAVRRQFELMRDVVKGLDGALQIIVCDHANLEESWFQDALVENWRHGVALIPADWLPTS